MPMCVGNFPLTTKAKPLLRDFNMARIREMKTKSSLPNRLLAQSCDENPLLSHKFGTVEQERSRNAFERRSLNLNRGISLDDQIGSLRTLNNSVTRTNSILRSPKKALTRLTSPNKRSGHKEFNTMSVPTGLSVD
jgi:hypothetical protein